MLTTSRVTPTALRSMRRVDLHIGETGKQAKQGNKGQALYAIPLIPF